ncbi:hypothetical protein [Actinopolymorpha cephalotaxi]|uniref:hypothetical protein n=1 Tax=Actinopolymorpha cephalotaxi TaxID=504797 RepID=UPI00192CED3E|nr:hypothetical protein [Actinopolymorpha cephalotaxi]
MRDDATWVLDPVPAKEFTDVTPTVARLTLVTCADLFRTTQRMVVFGHLVGTAPKTVMNRRGVRRSSARRNAADLFGCLFVLSRTSVFLPSPEAVRDAQFRHYPARGWEAASQP